MTLSTRAVKKDTLGLATKRAEKLLEEEEAVLVSVKETAEGARDTAEELKRRISINRQGSCRTATLEPERDKKLAEEDAELS